jgi:hypothetical protein
MFSTTLSRSSITIYTMQSCSDHAAFEWIRSARQELLASDDSHWKGNFVSHLLPTSFEAYAKILHSIEPNYKNIDEPLSDREISLLKIPPCKRLRSFVESLRQERQAQKIRWQALARLFGVPFESGICHEWFRAKMEEPRMLAAVFVRSRRREFERRRTVRNGRCSRRLRRWSRLLLSFR